MQQQGSDPLRLWVADCATGEEVYSLTLLFVDELLKLQKDPLLQIFATDTNPNLLNLARAARYPASTATKVDAGYLQRFFYKDDGFYRINQIIRDRVTFAVQEPLKDPPFAHLHLISCRHLLNTLQPQQQGKLIDLFYFALDPEGYLLLGDAAGMVPPAAQFSVVSEKWPIYRRSGSARPQSAAGARMLLVPSEPLADEQVAELRAANEEIMSFNEELQAFNEELEASREELQTLNAELLNTNQQMEITNHTLQAVNDDLNNLLANTGIATLFLDRQLHIRRFTPAVTELIRLIPTDTGRPVSDIATCFTDNDLSADIRQVLQNAAPLEKEIRSRTGQWYLRRVLPYITGDNQIDGAVVTFIDITSAKLDARRQEFLLQFYDTLRPLQQPDDIILHVARLTGEFFHAARCAYGVVDGLQTTVTINYDYNDNDSTWSGDYRLDNWDAEILQQLRQGRPLQIDDSEHDGRLQRIAQTRFATQDLRSLLMIPFSAGQQLNMLFAIGHRQPRSWLPAEIDLLRQMVERTWLALEQANADQARRDTKRQLERQAQQLQDNERHKNEFLSILGHELRNPLAAVHNTLQTLALQDQKNQHAQPLSAVLERQMRHMRRLIDDLLDISRINAGKIELERQPVMLTDCVNMALATLQSMFDASGHKLSISLPEQTLWLDGDPVRLVQILENLLSNAMKYSAHGSRIKLVAEPRNQNMVISVRDNGMGIAAEDLEPIFEIFAQSRDALKHSHNGLGLGLALVKQLVELHQGTVQAFSAGPGCGSEFVVTLPLANAPPAAADAGRTEAVVRPAAVTARRVLIIDDNADNADSLAALLTAMGHQVCAIYSGTAALATVHRFEPGYVFADISMPGMNGCEVARQLRREYAAGTLVLIALSGYGSDDDIRTARAAGFDHYLLKPVSLEEVNTLLATAG